MNPSVNWNYSSSTDFTLLKLSHGTPTILRFPCGTPTWSQTQVLRVVNVLGVSWNIFVLRFMASHVSKRSSNDPHPKLPPCAESHNRPTGQTQAEAPLALPWTSRCGHLTGQPVDEIHGTKPGSTAN